MTHKQCRELFVEALYGELPEPRKAEFEEHVQGCVECSGEFATLGRVVETMRIRERPERSTQDWVSFWNILSGRIRGERSRESMPRIARPIRSLLRRPSLAMAFAAAAILALGILIGRMGWTTEEYEGSDDRELAAPSPQRAALRLEAMDYLDRSKVLLLGIVNAEESSDDDVRLTQPQIRSRQLVRQGVELRARLKDADYQRLSALIGDLEVLLLEIANLQIENNFPGLEIVRDGVKRKGILLKINLEQMQSGVERDITAPAPAHPEQPHSTI